MNRQKLHGLLTSAYFITNSLPWSILEAESSLIMELIRLSASAFVALSVPPRASTAVTTPAKDDITGSNTSLSNNVRLLFSLKE